MTSTRLTTISESIAGHAIAQISRSIERLGLTLEGGSARVGAAPFMERAGLYRAPRGGARRGCLFLRAVAPARRAGMSGGMAGAWMKRMAEEGVRRFEVLRAVGAVSWLAWLALLWLA